MNPAYLSTFILMLAVVLSMRGLSSLVGSWFREEATVEGAEAAAVVPELGEAALTLRARDIAGRWS